MGCLMNAIIGFLVFLGLVALILAFPPLGLILMLILAIALVSRVL